MKDVLSYWLEKGVSGVRIDIVVCLFETMNADGSFPDEPVGNNDCHYDDHCYLNHIHTQDLDETFEMAYDWRQLFDDYKKNNGGLTRIIMTESWSEVRQSQRYYGNGQRNGSYIPFNFEMIKGTDERSTAKDYKKQVDAWLDNMPKGVEANWVVSSWKFKLKSFLN